MPFLRNLGLSLIAAALLAACASAPDDYARLTDTRWQLIQVFDRGALSYDDQPLPYLMLRAGDERSGRMEGFTGCNRLRGDYSGGGRQLRFDSMTSTRSACNDGLRQERQFMRALERTARVRVGENNMLLLDAEGRVLAQFRAQSAR